MERDSRRIRDEDQSLGRRTGLGEGQDPELPGDVTEIDPSLDTVLESP
jgi:hypothetical protein